MPTTDPHPARRLAAALEPVAGQVYFSPGVPRGLREARLRAPAPATMNGVALPDGPAYFCSRGSVMGQVPGELVAAAFAVFNPAVVVPAVDLRLDADRRGHHLRRPHRRAPPASSPASSATSPTAWPAPPSCWPGRRRALRPEGRPLYAGLLSLGLPGDPMGDAWRLADRLREYRGDAHTAAWTTRRLRRHRDRAAVRAVLGPAHSLVRPHPGVEQRRPRRRGGAPARPRASWRRGAADDRGAGARARPWRRPPTPSARRSSTPWATTSTSSSRS